MRDKVLHPLGISTYADLHQAHTIAYARNPLSHRQIYIHLVVLRAAGRENSRYLQINFPARVRNLETAARRELQLPRHLPPHQAILAVFAVAHPLALHLPPRREARRLIEPGPCKYYAAFRRVGNDK